MTMVTPHDRHKRPPKRRKQVDEFMYGGSMMTRQIVLALLGLMASMGVAAAQGPTVPARTDRLALRGAIACTWTLSDSPRQYEIFNGLREALTAVGQRQAGQISTEEFQAIWNRLDQSVKLTPFEAGALQTCLKTEIDWILSLISKP
jgi:hypothetical protein